VLTPTECLFFFAHPNAEGGEGPQGGAGGRPGEAEALCTNVGGTGAQEVDQRPQQPLR